MKVQHTNQTHIDAIAYDNANFVIENIQSGLTIDEACEAQYESASYEMFDEENYDAPYDKQQFVSAHKEAVIARLKESATDLWNYAQVHEEAYVRDYESENEIGEAVAVRVIKLDNEEFHIITGEQEDFFHEVA